MNKKLFHKTTSDKLKRAFVVAAALFALSGQNAQAQGFLGKITDAITDVNNFVNRKINTPIADFEYNVGRLKKTLDKADKNTGKIVSSTLSSLKAQRKEKGQEPQSKVSSTQTVAKKTPQTISANKIQSSSNAQYLSTVRQKLNTKNEEASKVDAPVQEQKESAKIKQKKANVASSADVQKVLDILNSGGRP